MEGSIIIRSLKTDSYISDQLFLPGFVLSPSNWLVHADVFVLSTRWEGFGHVIIEAMASGVPVIATDCPHGPRDIIQNGFNGLLVKMNDPISISSAIDYLLCNENESDDLKSNAYISMMDFDIDVITNKYIDLFNKVNGNSN